MNIQSVKGLGIAVRERRKELGWSQGDLAARAGVQRLWISQFENGKTTAQIGLVLRTLRSLDLNVQVAPKDFSYSADKDSGTPPFDLNQFLEENFRTEGDDD